jgi:hypothetical protein
MKQVGRREGILWMIVGGVICALSGRIGLGSFVEPGPGFVAFAAGVSLGVIGLIMVLSRPSVKCLSNEDRGIDHSRWTFPKFRLIYTILLLAAYGLVLQPLGYLLTTFLAMFGLFYDRGTNRFVPSFLASLLTVGMTYLVFETWLRVQLPRGILPWW